MKFSMRVQWIAPGPTRSFIVVDERIVGLKPTSLSFAEAAALPLTSITAWEMLFDRMQVPHGSRTPGGTLLVLNGAGGLGSMLIQLANRLRGLTVIASASRPETVEWGKKLGAHTNGSKQERLLGRPCWKAFSNDCRLWPPRGVVCAAS